MKTEKPIIIAGAGPAGLCAAINLAKAGYKVVVYEKNPDVGFQHQGQIQAIENVFYNIDTMEWLQGLNIERNFYYRPINDISFFSYDFKKYDFNSKFPLVYLIQRGNKENSLDYSFKKQAVDLGVKFQFNSEIQSSEADVVATGPPRPTYMASGINFKTDLSDLVWLIFDSNLSPKGYCYFLVCNGQATIASFIKCNFKDSRKYLGKTVDALEKLFNLVIENADYFTGFGYFDINYNFSKIVIGEAAGFQEYLFGFGTKYAMHSGYLASKSTIFI
ncbi:MAG: NAD(P)-binding protein [Candidatus Saganbacteria bacterium]|nr:NAD(P)-binding protein [Candidatus Saganbacteria bacterium]